MRKALYLSHIVCVLAFTSVSCNRVDYSSGLVHRGKDSVSISEMGESFLFEIDASHTSLDGQWFLIEDRIGFVDKYSVGVKFFDLDGHWMGKEVREGRGPDEMSQPAWVSAYDSEHREIVFHDNNSVLLRYDSSFRQTFNTHSAWPLFLDSTFTNSSWEKLYSEPDAEVLQMYEYNPMVKRMFCRNDTLLIPVVTEHVKFNGYEAGRSAKDFWRTSYVLLQVMLGPNAKYRLIGHYPSVYQRKNIPVFSFYDFAVRDSLIYVSFAADPLIYVYDMDGNPVYSMGFAVPDIKCDYPETFSVDEYERYYRAQKMDYGYYDRLVACGDYLFRSCRTDKGLWKLQVYQENDLVGVIDLDSEIDIFGFHDGWYYACIGLDLENERFKMIRFRLDA